MCFDIVAKLTVLWICYSQVQYFLIQRHSMLYTCSEGAFCAVRVYDMNTY